MEIFVLTTMTLLIRGGPGANNYCDGAVSPRSIVSAMIALVQMDRSLSVALSSQTKINLEATLPNEF